MNERKYFYRIKRFENIFHIEVENLLNSICSRGGRIVNVDSHLRTLYIIIEYTKDEIAEVEHFEAMERIK